MRSWSWFLAPLVVTGLEDIVTRDLLTAITEHDSCFVLLYTPSCEPCKRLEPSLDEFAQTVNWEKSYGLTGNLTDIIFRKINVRDDPEAESMLQVRGTPSMMLLKGPWINEFTGDIRPELLGAWIAKRVGPVSTQIQEDELEDFISPKGGPEDVSIVVEASYVGGQRFEIAAGSEREHARYGWINKTDDSWRNKDHGRITIYKTGLDKPLVFDNVDLGNHNEVFKIITDHQLPLFGIITPNNLVDYLRHPRRFVWFVCDTVKQFQTFKEKTRDLYQPEKFGSEFHWVALVNETDPRAREFAATVLMISKAQSVGLAISDAAEEGRYRLDSFQKLEKMDLKEITSFVQRVVDNEEDMLFRATPVSGANRYPVSVTKSFEVISSQDLEPRILEERNKTTLLYLSGMCNEASRSCAEVDEWVAKFASNNAIAGLRCLRILNIDMRENELDRRWGFKPREGNHAVWVIPPNKKNEYTKVSQVPRAKIAEFSSFEKFVAAIAHEWPTDCDVAKAATFKDEL